MCTLSILRLREGYSLMFNRDESPLREAARAVAGLSDDAGQVQALYPLDPPSQGSFVGVNRAGVAFGLLNQHPSAYQRPAQTQSRGRLIPLALAAPTAIAGLERVAALDLSMTPPFLLVGVDEASAPMSLRWDGRELQRRLHEDGAFQTSSSSVQAADALTYRRRGFDRLLETLDGQDDAVTLAAQEAYHFSQTPQPGALAVWMQREDAESVSFSHVLVLPTRAILRHQCRADREARLEPLQQSLER